MDLDLGDPRAVDDRLRGIERTAYPETALTTTLAELRQRSEATMIEGMICDIALGRVLVIPRVSTTTLRFEELPDNLEE